MKQILFLLIPIVWSVWQARQKALREQVKKAKQANSDALGAVTAEENNSVADPAPVTVYSQRSQEIRQEADQFVREVTPQLPESVRKLQKASRRKKKIEETPQVAIQNDELVERLVTVPVVEDAYSEKIFVRRGISFDKQSMRTFFVTREVLGAPRSRKPFRPGLRGRE